MLATKPVSGIKERKPDTKNSSWNPVKWVPTILYLKDELVPDVSNQLHLPS